MEPPARATTRSAADERLAERVDVLAQVVVRRPGSRSAGVVARAGHVEHAEGRVRERLDGGEVDRARAERAAEDQHAVASGGMPNAARSAARGRRRSAVPGPPVTR